MRESCSDPALRIVRHLALVAVASITLLTLVDRGATRAYSSPWLLLLWLAPGATLLALAARACFTTPPLRLPAKTWSLPVAALAAVLTLAALFSVHRGPSLLVAFTSFGAIAAFFLAHDFVREHPGRRSEALLRATAQLLAIVTALSVVRWAIDFFSSDNPSLLGRLLARNPHPLGHSNYTAGLALLALPCFAALAAQSRGRPRAAWTAALAGALLMLFTSGSRAGWIGLAALGAGALFHARLDRRRLCIVLLLAAGAACVLTFAHPRTRAALLGGGDDPALVRDSDVQRAAMLTAGLRMGADRPLLGWGPGTTPLVFPLYRGGLDGGAENVLQLHSTPVQLWADCGVPGLACGVVVLVLLVCAVVRLRPPPGERPSAPAVLAVALAGYGVFALFDYQLDVPVFAFVVAVFAAAVAPPAAAPVSREAQANLGILAALAPLLVAFFGSGDPAPLLNTRAFALAADPAQHAEARKLFESSLALNPHQEIAHFNLGWLLLVSEPARAEEHFRAAARLVPDKGGVYFGLALARRNQSRPDDPLIPRALALECLNDPLFLTSPWWRQPDFAALREQTLAQLSAWCERAAARFAAQDDPRAADARYVAALAAWIDGRVTGTQVLPHATTRERRHFFAENPAPPDFAASRIGVYRRERVGYPVLMRDLDLPTPVDLFDVQENLLASGPFAFLFPAKGWLPAPLLLALLDESLSAKP